MINASPEGPWIEPEHVTYVRNQNNWSGITYFTDKCIHYASSVQSNLKVAILLEPREFMPSQFIKTLRYMKTFLI